MRKSSINLAMCLRPLVLLLATVFLAAPFALSAEPQNTGTTKAESTENATAKAQDAKDQSEQAQPATKKININKASAKELESLPGIGPALSKRIVEGRPYESIEDIMKVKGIGQKTFDKIKDKITVK